MELAKKTSTIGVTRLLRDSKIDSRKTNDLRNNLSLSRKDVISKTVLRRLINYIQIVKRPLKKFLIAIKNKKRLLQMKNVGNRLLLCGEKFFLAMKAIF